MIFLFSPKVLQNAHRCVRSSMTSQDIEGACRCQAGEANLGSIFNYPLLESVSPPLVACDCINQRGGVNHPPVPRCRGDLISDTF